MEFEKPNNTGFTIYSKSGCQNCIKIKNLLKEKKETFNVVDCDEYILEDKEGFLLFIRDLAEKECKVFPMIFYEGKFIGGYIETCHHIDKLLTSFDENMEF
jgi:glutaredoxin